MSGMQTLELLIRVLSMRGLRMLSGHARICALVNAIDSAALNSGHACVSQTPIVQMLTGAQYWALVMTANA